MLLLSTAVGPSLVLFGVLAAAPVLSGCNLSDVADDNQTASGFLMLSGITLQTVSQGRFVGAQNNGGGAVNATATMAQEWETFAFQDVNGGSLASGDSVFIRAGDSHYFQAVNGGGTTLNAASNNALAWETFKVVKQSGMGTVNNGDVIGLQDSAGTWVSAANGGGGAVFAYGPSFGSWEQFKISGLPAVGTVPRPTPTPMPTPTPTPAPTPPPSIGTTISNVSFRAMLNNTYVGATNNGGSSVVATATTAQGSETFSLVDINGGSLESGDGVFIKAGNGQYFQALNGGGSSLNAASNNRLGWEMFKVVKKSGGAAINTGDLVGLQTATGSWVSAANGGGGAVSANGGALGSWESFAIGIGAPAAPPAPGPSSTSGDWRLVWADEFNGTGLDTSKWSYEVHAPGWVNNELEYYTARPDNVRVESGHLVIEGRRDFYNGAQYSSGRINTAGHASWTYGRMEASIQLPGGRGTWPGFWMMPDDFSRGWPACGDIDIVEEVGWDPNAIYGKTRSQTYHSDRTSGTTSNAGVTTGYHLYAVEWYPDRIDFFLDGQKYFTSSNDNTGDDAWPFHKSYYFILDLAIGGDWGGQEGIDTNIWPRQLLVDYVRVYQK